MARSTWERGAGAALGGSIAKDAQRRHHPQQFYASLEDRCGINTNWQETEQVIGWDVVYEYQGETYLTRMKDKPGEYIEVRVEDDTLVLRGERKRDDEVEEKNAYRLERTFGAFTRRFTLPKTVDASRIDARYKDGVLQVTLPKAEEAKPKKIAIKAA